MAQEISVWRITLIFLPASLHSDLLDQMEHSNSLEESKEEKNDSSGCVENSEKLKGKKICAELFEDKCLYKRYLQKCGKTAILFAQHLVQNYEVRRFCL